VLNLGGGCLDRGGFLDVGCGGGWLLEALAKRGARPGQLRGVDALPARVEAASRRVPAADVDAADARALPFDDDSFELVTLIAVLSSMRDDTAVAAALEEARRVTAPTGLVLCYEPRLPNPLNRHTRRISRRELECGPGGELVATRSLTGFPPLARHLGGAAPHLYPLLSRIAPTHRLVALAEVAAQRGRG
jgi:SAM-dependent methyltransferase